MVFDQQLIVRIKSFLNASDLTDSATARELYDAYREVNDAMAKRVVECGLLIQKNQKIEAVLEARRPPELFEMIDAMLCPERGILAQLADLYEWPRWDDLDMETVAAVRAAVRGMDDLRPLLTEFRRVARTDQLETKLQLLRDIYRMDDKNPEWREALSEVENQYLFRLIAEAQQVIEDKNDDRLLAIREELRRPDWLVSIPTIVMQKIDKIAEEIGQRRLREQAEVLLERIDRAIREFDNVALEDALLCWEKHCQGTGYQPTQAETQQIDAAKLYLKEEKRKLEEQQKFQRIIEETGAFIDRRAPLHEVENRYAAAEAMNMAMPPFIADRVRKYRDDTIRSRRTSAVLKGIKIVVTAVLLIVIFGGVTLLAIQFNTEKKIINELTGTIRDGKLTEAQAMIADIERKHPRLAKSAKVTRAKAEIAKAIEEEKTRVESLKENIGELTELLSAPDPNRSAIRSKLSHAEKLAKSDDERARVKELDERRQLLFASIQKTNETRFTGQLERLRTLRNEVAKLIARGKNTGDFDAVRKKLEEMDDLAAKMQDISAVREKLYNDNEELLESRVTLREELNKAETRYRQIEQCLDNISGAQNLTALESALNNLNEIRQHDNEFPEELNRLYNDLTRDLKTFKAIVVYQSESSPQDDAGPQSGFFADAAALAQYKNTQFEALQRLIRDFQNMRQRVNREQLFFIRMLDGDGRKLDFYLTRGVIIGRNECTLKRNDGVLVKIRKPWSCSQVSVGNTNYRGCELKFPHDLDKSDTIYDSIAPHQLIIDEFCKTLQDSNDTNTLQLGITFLKRLYADEKCSPFWKMQLSRRVLAALIPLDRSPDGELKMIADGFQNIEYSGDTEPLYDRKLLDKIESYIASRCTPERLDRILAINELLLRRERIVAERKFIYLGVCLNRKNGQRDYSARGNISGSSGDIWCFDKQSIGSLIVGRYSGSEIIPNGSFKGNAEGRLLFTTMPPGNMKNETRQWLNDPAAVSLESMDWPKFWPANMRKE